MTKYLDEYIPNSKNVARRVQQDARKLKFNNIQSCIAIVLVPRGTQTMIGLHLSTPTFNNVGELRGACEELGGAVAGGAACDAYLVAAFARYRNTPLVTELKKRANAKAIYVCDVAADPTDASGSADVDVKFEVNAGRMEVFVRRHAVGLRDPAQPTAFLQKPGFDRRTATPGKPSFVTDRDSKPWMPVTFERMT